MNYEVRLGHRMIDAIETVTSLVSLVSLSSFEPLRECLGDRQSPVPRNGQVEGSPEPFGAWLSACKALPSRCRAIRKRQLQTTARSDLGSKAECRADLPAYLLSGDGVRVPTRASGRTRIRRAKPCGSNTDAVGAVSPMRPSSRGARAPIPPTTLLLARR